MLYIEIAKNLASRILGGEYQTKGKLPSELSLADEFDTSKMTIRKALDVLRESGVIYSIPKQGYYINTLDDIRKFNALSGNSISLVGSKSRLYSKVISFEIIEASSHLKSIFKKDLDKLIRLKRLRYLEKNLYSVETVYLDFNLFPHMEADDAVGSIYEYITTRGYNIATNLKTIRANFAPVEFLEYEPMLRNIPLIEMENTGFLTNGAVFEYSLAYNIDASYSSFIKFDNILNSIHS